MPAPLLWIVAKMILDRIRIGATVLVSVYSP